MARGVKIYGADGIQIDNDYLNYTYYEGGNYTVGVGTTTIPITPTEDAVIAAIRPTTSGVAFNWGLTVSGTYYTGVIIKSDAVQEIGYAVFKDGDSGTLSNDYGLKIYRPDGTVAFDSRNKYLKLVEIHEVNDANLTPYNFDVNDTDNNYFMVKNFFYYSDWDVNYDDGEWNWYSKGMKKIDSNTLSFVMLKVYTLTESGLGASGHSSGNSSVAGSPYYIVEFEGVN